MIQNKEGTVGKSLLGQKRSNRKENKKQRHTQPELQRQHIHTCCAATETHSNTHSCTRQLTHIERSILSHRDKKMTHTQTETYMGGHTHTQTHIHTHTHLWSIKHCTSWSYINGREKDRASKLLARLPIATVFWRLITRKCSQLFCKAWWDITTLCTTGNDFFVQIHFYNR